ncbi:MAG: DUF4855 domain-containing protein [Bacteroidales bacterium]|nr:DUF4855 domain-containing protein [Bacteroidales bacterium]
MMKLSARLLIVSFAVFATSCTKTVLQEVEKYISRPNVDMVEKEIPFEQCSILNLEGDAVLSTDNGPSVKFTMRELFDGRWMSGYQRWSEVAWKFFGWDGGETHPWFTFDVSRSVKLYKLAVMPYRGLQGIDPAQFELWAYVADGQVPAKTREDWYLSDTNWVRILDADFSYLRDKAISLSASDIGKSGTDPCVEGEVAFVGNCCDTIPRARYYRFRLLNNFNGAFRDENNGVYWTSSASACNMSELRLWESVPVCHAVDTLPQVATECRDLVLYYCGGPLKKDAASVPDFNDYIMTDEQSPRWMFDGALLLEQHYNTYYTYMGLGYDRKCCTKDMIEGLFSNWFDVILPRLDANLESAKSIVSAPFHKHKIVLMIPVLPYFSQGDGYKWGDIEGLDTSDWSKWTNTLEVYKWEIDRMVQGFAGKGYRNLELIGFYWPVENAGLSTFHLSEISGYVHSLGYIVNFIPYFSEKFVLPVYSNWKDNGFDFCYLQPNYFFNIDVPYSRLARTVELARKYGMDLEFEFSPSWHQDCAGRMDQYMDVFDSLGVFANNNIAYYQGTTEFSYLKNKKGTDDYLYSMYKRLSNYVAKRHEEFYEE